MTGVGDAEPVAVGGVGGSGTRVLAHLLRELGFYIGDDLNPALDNRWFAMLCVRPHWRLSRPAQVPIALSVFEKAMRGGARLDPGEERLLREAVLDWTSLAPSWAPVICAGARGIRESSGPQPGAVGWGWKDPGTHLYVEQLAERFPGMKYVHLVRNGLDLASKPKARRQARAWGPLIGVDLEPSIPTNSPQAALRYWIDANRRIFELGPRLFGERFLALRYEAICEDPAGAVATLADFLEVPAEPAVAERFTQFVEVPPSRRDPTREAAFDSADLAAVQAMGFAIF